MRHVRKKPLERSSLEAYGSLVIGILIAFVRLTWYVKVGLIVVVIAAVWDVAWNSQWTIKQSRVEKLVLALLTSITIIVIAWFPIRNQYLEDAKGGCGGKGPSFVYVLPNTLFPSVADKPDTLRFRLYQEGNDPIYNINVRFAEVPLRNREMTRTFAQINPVCEGHFVWSPEYEWEWTPTNKGDQHYEITLMCSRGLLEEDLRMKPKGIDFTYAIRVMNVTTGDELIDCESPEFVQPGQPRKRSCFPTFIDVP